MSGVDDAFERKARVSGDGVLGALSCTKEKSVEIGGTNMDHVKSHTTSQL